MQIQNVQKGYLLIFDTTKTKVAEVSNAEGKKHMWKEIMGKQVFEVIC